MKIDSQQSPARSVSRPKARTSDKSASKLKHVRRSNVLFEGDVPAIAKKLVPGTVVYRIVMGICAVILAGCGAVASHYFHQVLNAQGEFDDLSVRYTVTPVPEQGPKLGKDEDGLPPVVDFDGLKAENPDTAGWIRIPNTTVDYPVVKSNYADEYLYRSFYGGYSIMGSIFLDHDNAIEPTDDHIVIYGHHMDTSVMFHDVSLYRYEDFFDDHRVIYYETPETTYVLRPVGVHIADAAEYGVRRVKMADEQDFQRYFTEQMDDCGTVYRDDYQRATTDKLFTLITCTNYGDTRLIVQCVVDQVYPTSYVPNVIANSADIVIEE